MLPVAAGVGFGPKRLPQLHSAAGNRSASVTDSPGTAVETKEPASLTRVEPCLAERLPCRGAVARLVSRA